MCELHPRSRDCKFGEMSEAQRSAQSIFAPAQGLANDWLEFFNARAVQPAAAAATEDDVRGPGQLE